MANDEKVRISGEQLRTEAAAPVLPVSMPNTAEKPPQQSGGVHASVYIAVWISLSSSVILFNKWILTNGFKYPIILTTWHLAFATLMTQLMARFSTRLDSRHNVPMTGRVYLRAIVPIGAMFSLSLIFGNLTYLYLSVSFIQMLKATTPVVVLLTTWLFGLAPPNMKTLGNVSIIVLGVIIASAGELQFVLIGVIFQLAGILFEAFRLTMVQRLLSSAEFKMDPLVSLYYFAPACAAMNAVVALVIEVPKFQMQDLWNIGIFVLLANAMVAFFLNVSVVLLLGKTNAVVYTLSGVLKDILLVFASMVIFRDPVAPLQFFGYSIALGGLVHYKLGMEKIKEYFGGFGKQWSEYSSRHPAMSKFVIFGIALFFILIVMGGLFPYVPPQYTESAVRKAQELGGFGGAQ